MKKLYVGWMILYDPSVHRELYKANIDTALYLDIINGDDICFEQRFHHWLLCAGNNSYTYMMRSINVTQKEEGPCQMSITPLKIRY